MRKWIKIALWSTAGVVVASGCAGLGFYEGVRVGAGMMSSMAVSNDVYDALFEVRSSMAALGKNDLDLSQHQLALNLRVALFSLGALSKADNYVRCSDKQSAMLADAASYMAAHPDPVMFNGDPFLLEGVKFCESRYRLPVGGDGGAGRLKVTGIRSQLD
jgi:hypothetical protein